MPGYADVIYNPAGVYVAALNSANTYSTPERFEYLQGFNWNTTTDTDSIKAYGVEVESLAILTGAEGSAQEASISLDIWQILTGFTKTESGATPNRTKEIVGKGGGQGYPYVGLIIEYSAVQAAGMVVGFAKSQLAELPDFEVEQNSFRTGEMSFKMLGANSTSRGIFRMRQYESASDVPDFSAASAFDTFLGGLFS